MTRGTIAQMESRQGLEAKGKILVDALVMCLQRSKVREVCDPTTIRSVILSALGELWREGEFRLEPVWKILCQQPGVSAEQVAPPLLVFKAYEEQLGVTVRLPQAVASVPRGEQARLRDQLGIKSEEFAQVLRELADLATAESDKRDYADASAKAAAGESPSAARRATATATATRRKLATVATVLGALALVAISAALYVSLSDTAAGFDTKDVATILQIGAALRAGESLSARITDPRWETLSKDEQRRLAGQLFDRERPKGIKAMTLTDGASRVRVTATDTPAGRQIIIP